MYLCTSIFPTSSLCPLFDKKEIWMHTNILCRKTQIQMRFLVVQNGGRGCRDFKPIMWVLREFVERKLWWDSERRDQKLPVANFRFFQRHLLLWEFWSRSQISVYNSSPGHPLSHREREVISPYLLGGSKSWRASKSYNWLKSYGEVAEWVDFADWWSFSV